MRRRMPRPALWVTAVGLIVLAFGATAEDKTAFRFGYMPSQHKIRHLILSPAAEMTDWKVLVTAQGKAEVLAQQLGRFPFNQAGETMDVPDLPEGQYMLTAQLTGKGQPAEFARTFVRQHFPWENSTLGKDPIVVPPFTPLEVNAEQRRVDCILRQHTISSSGLWEQVTSQQKPLLAAPITLRATVGAKQYVAAGPGAVFTKTPGNHVTGRAAWTAGPLQGCTRFDFDYDGFMRVDLDVESTAERVEALDLVVPLNSGEACLMHSVTDLLRSHYAGRIPEGQGKVWDSAKVPRYQLPGPFLPYIWLGGTERGICWIAENDRDWVLDEKLPTHEIIREGKSVSLVVHFVTRPSTLTRRRTISFALMATPAKPMPQQPANYRAWWPVTTANKEGVDITLAGACYYWGSQTPCLQFYPAFRNFSIFEEAAAIRRTGKADMRFTDQWLQQFKGPQYTEELKKTYRAHVDWMLYNAKGAPKVQPGAPKVHYLIPYTNPRAINWDQEVQTYLDEWSIYDVADPRWNQAVKDKLRLLRENEKDYNDLSGVAYEVDPLPSYADMVLYYHKKMYETFADGVYWDDFFVLANYNPVSGPAYVDDDGRLRPGVSWFAFRELAKRNAVMQHQMSMRPLAWIHMTNCNVVPALSFGTLLFEWEWRDQGEFAKRDFQDRLDVDSDTSLILAESTGLQSGNLTVSLDLFRPPPGSGVSREWLVRTGLAVCVPHEIKLPASDAVHQKVIGLLDAMGYGRPECKVYRYWDADKEVATSGTNVKTLTLSRPGKVLVFVGSYGYGGECQIALDLSKLGLSTEAKATNGETGKPVQRLSPGRFMFPIQKHDFQIILVDEKG
ncbi:MAG: DUF6067 family protein [Planctomycetota bacterium]|nr:DUF6067 family protein [Planctomycetota bacterium]